MSSLGVVIWQYFWKKIFFFHFIAKFELKLEKLEGLRFYPAFEVSPYSKQERHTWAGGKLLKAQNISKMKWVINQKKKEVRNLEFIKAKVEKAHARSEEHLEMDTPCCLFSVAESCSVTSRLQNELSKVWDGCSPILPYLLAVQDYYF